jgi:hypothetical protein
MAQVGPEFKPPYSQKKKKKNKPIITQETANIKTPHFFFYKMVNKSLL